MRAAAHDAGELAGWRVAVHGSGLGGCPEPRQPLGDAGCRVGGDQDAVHRADRGPYDEVGRDAVLEERLQHAHLDRAEHAPAAEYESDGLGSDRLGGHSIIVPRGVRAAPD